MQNMYNCVQCCKVKEGNLFQHFLFTLSGARFWIQSKIQGRKIHHWTCSHDQGQWLGLTRMTNKQTMLLDFDRFFTDHCRMWCVLPYDDEGKVDLGPGKLCHCCRLGLLSLCVWVGCRTVFMSLSFISLRKSLSMDQLIRIHRKLDLNGILSHTHTHTLSLDEERLNFPFKEQGLGIQSRQNTSVIYLSMPPII